MHVCEEATPTHPCVCDRPGTDASPAWPDFSPPLEGTPPPLSTAPLPLPSWDWTEQVLAPPLQRARSSPSSSCARSGVAPLPLRAPLPCAPKAPALLWGSRRDVAPWTMGRRPPASHGRTRNGAPLGGIWANSSCCSSASPTAAGGEDEGPALCPASRGLALRRSLSPRFRARSLELAHSPDRGRSVRSLGATPGPQSAHCGRDTGSAARAPVPLCPWDDCPPESPESPAGRRRACTACSAGRGAHEWAAVARPGGAGSLPGLGQTRLRPAAAALAGLCGCSRPSPWEANLLGRASAGRSPPPCFLLWTQLSAAEQGELPRGCARRFWVAFCRETFNHTEFSL